MLAQFIILVSLPMTLFSEKVLISTRCISGLMPNLIEKILDGLYSQALCRPHSLISTDFSSHFQWMVFVIYTQRGNQLLHYNLLCLLLYPFWGLETTLCHRTHWSPDFLWIRVALVWFYSKFMIIWIKDLKIRYTLMLHSNAIISGLSRGAGFFGGNHDTRWGNRLHCMAENPLPLPNFKVWPKHFCLPHEPNFSDIFDLCLHWVSVVRGGNNLAIILFIGSESKCHKKLRKSVRLYSVFQKKDHM